MARPLTLLNSSFLVVDELRNKAGDGSMVGERQNTRLKRSATEVCRLGFGSHIEMNSMRSGGPVDVVESIDREAVNVPSVTRR
jgi:hypothetical protein